MDILTFLVITLVVLGIVYLSMLILFNAVAIYYLVKYWPYMAYGWKKLKEQVDEDIRLNEPEFDCVKITKCNFKIAGNKCGAPIEMSCVYREKT